MIRTPTLLETELRQTRPFASRLEEAVVGLFRTAEVVRRALGDVLGAKSITLQQYNVLRILRGAGADGLCRNEVRDRLINRMPDVTRLLDRMEEAGLVTRERDTADRRLVTTHLTARGRELVDSLDTPTAEEHQRRMGHLSEDQRRTLIGLLSLVRNPG